MIGLGVGIDYALFIVTRFRENFANDGDVELSVVQAMDTSGRAILLAGTTVIIALLGMFATGVTFLYGLAIASVLAVLLVLVCLADGAAGAALALGRAGRAPEPPVPAPGGDGRSAARIVVAPLERDRPVAAVAAGGGLVRWWSVVLLVPVLGLRLDSATPATTRRTRAPTAPSTCSRMASGLASTGRCWSSVELPGPGHDAAVPAIRNAVAHDARRRRGDRRRASRRPARSR